jgi:hypothetical protein
MDLSQDMKDAGFVFREMTEEEMKKHQKYEFSIEKTGSYVKFAKGVQNTVTGEIFCDPRPENP